MFQSRLNRVNVGGLHPSPPPTGSGGVTARTRVPRHWRWERRTKRNAPLQKRREALFSLGAANRLARGHCAREAAPLEQWIVPALDGLLQLAVEHVGLRLREHAAVHHLLELGLDGAQVRAVHRVDADILGRLDLW